MELEPITYKLVLHKHNLHFLLLACHYFGHGELPVRAARRAVHRRELQVRLPNELRSIRLVTHRDVEHQRSGELIRVHTKPSNCPCVVKLEQVGLPHDQRLRLYVNLEQLVFEVIVVESVILPSKLTRRLRSSSG